MKEMKISAIRRGTVIDHIPTKNTFRVVELLGIKEHNDIVSVATNLESKKVGIKGMIKIGERKLTQEEVNKIAVLAPNATVSIIENYNVAEKFKLKLTKEVNNILPCSNPKCITNMEKVSTRFYVVQENPIKLRCHYCERTMAESDIKVQ